MHNIEQFGGMRIYPAGTTCIIVQFDTEENMNRWLDKMRLEYPTQEQFSPSVDRNLMRVVY